MIKKIKEFSLRIRTFIKTKQQIQEQILELSKFETRRTHVFLKVLKNENFTAWMEYER